MTNSRVTLRSVAWGLALGLLCCWWILRSETTVPPQREVARATGASGERERPSKPRARIENPDTTDDATTPSDEVAPTAPKPPRRVAFHVVGDDDEKPIAGARISHSYVHPASPCSTDAAGDAMFDASEVESDATYFQIEAPGRVRTHVRIEFESQVEVRRTVSLAPGFAVDGVVLDADGRPVSGARCRVDGPGDCMGAGEELVSIRADAEGRFHADGLPLNLRLVFRFSDPRRLDRIVLRRAHDTSFLDVRLEAGGVIRGTVRGPDERPLAGARVVARAEDRAEAEVETGEDGRYEIGGLKFGPTWRIVLFHGDCVGPADTPTFDVSAEAPEVVRDLRMLAPKRLELVLTGPDDERRTGELYVDWSGGTTSAQCSVPGRLTLGVGRSGKCFVRATVDGLRVARATIDVGPDEAQSHELRFERGCALRGIAVDDVGAPVPGAAIVVESEADDRGQAVVADAAGAFSVTGLAPGGHAVSAKAPGRGPSAKTTVETPTEDVVRVVLPRFGVAAGRLRLPDGAPRPVARRVSWTPEDFHAVDGEERWTSEEFAQELASGKWELEIAVEGYVGVFREIVVEPGARMDLGTIELQMETPLVGRVVDAEGRAVPGASIFVEGTPGRMGFRSADSAADGRFAVPRLAPAEYEVRVAHDDFVEFKTTYVLTKDGAPLAATLQCGAVLHVRLRGPDEKALRNYAVTVDRGADTTEVDALGEETAGQYSDRVRAGTWRIRVVRREDDVVVATREIELREGEDKTIDVDLPK